MRDDLLAGRQEQQLNRLGERRLGRHVDECSVAHERGIQRGERPVLRREVLAEVLTNEIGPMGEDVGKILNIVKERRRERTLKKTVDKNETITGLEE